MVEWSVGCVVLCMRGGVVCGVVCAVCVVCVWWCVWRVGPSVRACVCVYVRPTTLLGVQCSA